MRLSLTALAALTVSAAMAIPLPEDFDYKTFDATTGFDVQTKVANPYAGYSGGVWLDNWTSGVAPHSGTNYFTNGYITYAPKQTTSGVNPEFPGDLLALNSLIETPQGSRKLTFKELLGLEGGALGIGSTGQGVITTGDFSIRSSEENPFSIQRCSSLSASYIYAFDIRGKFRATPESVLTFCGNDKYATTNAQWLFTFKFPETTDVSEFYGKVRLADAKVELDSAVFGGTFEMTNEWFGVTVDPLGRPVENTPPRLYANACDTSAKGVILHESAQFDLATTAYNWTVGDLTDDGGEILFKVSQTANQGGTLTITNSISIADRLRIVNTAAAWKTVDESEPVAMPLIVFGADVDLDSVDADSFELVQTLAAVEKTGSFPIPQLVLRESGNGTKTLYLTRNKIIKNIVLTSDTKTFDYGTGNRWSDGLPEHGGVDYYLTYNGKQPQYYFESDCVFPAENLLAYNGEIFPHARIYVTNLVFGGAIGFHVNGRGDYGIDGRLGLFGLDNKATFANVNPVKANYTFEIASDIYGPGGLTVKGLGTTTLSGDNTAHSGRLTVCTDVSALRIDNATCLGGAMGEFTYNGVTLGYTDTEKYASLMPLRTMTIDEPTRGILISNRFEFAVNDGVAFTVKSPMTYFGELRKSGAGTLVLASKARFVDGNEATDPLDGANVLKIVGGALKVADAEALNGLDVTFAPGTSLHLDAVAEGDLATYGVKMTRNLSSLAPGSAGGTIRVVLDVAEGAEFSRNIATFATEAEAEACAARMDVRLSVPGYRASLSVVPNGGVYTVKGDVFRSGIMLIVR